MATDRPTHRPVLTRAALERFRSSLFFLPLLYVMAAIVLAQGLLYLDSRVEGRDLPLVFRSSVENARSLLSAIAGATITVAGIVFSVTMIAVQLASSQFSPRVLRGFMRDRFQQRVMGYLVGTFAFCLLVLRAIRVQDGEDVIPNISVAVAVVLGVGAVIAILAYIDHTARAIQVSHIIRSIADETLAVVRQYAPAGERSEPELPLPETPDRAHIVRARSTGWLQQLDLDVLHAALPPDTTLVVDTRVGRFVNEGMCMGLVWPVPDDTDAFDEHMHDAIQTGKVRTMQQDLAFGFRQLVDLALRALSPGINDPATAYEVIVHLRTVLFELLRRDLPPAVTRGDEGQVVALAHELDHDDYVARAFNQIREVAVDHPEVAIELLKAMAMLVRELEHLGLHARTEALRGQATHLVDGIDRAGPLPYDRDRVHSVASRLGFGAAVRSGA